MNGIDQSGKWVRKPDVTGLWIEGEWVLAVFVEHVTCD